jgi:hypothetical protein
MTDHIDTDFNYPIAALSKQPASNPIIQLLKPTVDATTAIPTCKTTKAQVISASAKNLKKPDGR